MKYVEFKIGDKDMAIEMSDDYNIETNPLLIKLGPKNNKYFSFTIN